MTQAVSVCRRRKRFWRAASLCGGHNWSVSASADSGSSDPVSYQVQGNVRLFLWREMCRQLAGSEAAGPSEQAVYATLGGAIERALPHCGTWHDACWVYLRKLIDDQLDHAIYAQFDPAQPPVSEHDEVVWSTLCLSFS